MIFLAALVKHECSACTFHPISLTLAGYFVVISSSEQLHQAVDIRSARPNALPGPSLDVHLKVLRVLRVALQPVTTQHVTGTSLSHASTILVQQDFGNFYTPGESNIIF